MEADEGRPSPMIRIATTAEAFEALTSTLPVGSVGFEPQPNEKGERLVWLETVVVDPGEASSGRCLTISTRRQAAKSGSRSPSSTAAAGRDRGAWLIRGKTLFHYTQVFRAVMILRDGVIRRSSGNTPPYVWLSSNPTNEPTACRAALSMEKVRQCNERELFALQGWARFMFHGCDATPWVDLQLTSDARRGLENHPTVVVSNAALVEQVPLSEITPDHYDRTFALNAKAPLFLVQKMLPMMGRGGSIILVSSAMHYMGLANHSTYAATKAALRSYSRT